ncbi:uncharacterized protein [Engystomops pustulosus]|uniref:uncharacterized protein n=1 Tax=Engystomops pustulosus TaxID=76066 RepID=UPI003AFA1074
MDLQLRSVLHCTMKANGLLLLIILGLGGAEDKKILPFEATCSTTGGDIRSSRANVFCPTNCLKSKRNVWGTDIYIDASPICKAAIHAGALTNDGGHVAMKKLPGQFSYTGCTRHGIKSRNCGYWLGSFTFFKTSSPVTPEPRKETTKKPSVTIYCTTTAKDIAGSSANVFCPAECLANGRSVWGTQVYTDDSSICRAAIHAGIISNSGGEVTLLKTPGQASYSGSAKNGITTNNYGAWTGSFIFVNSSSPVTPQPTKVVTQKPPVTVTCTTTASEITESSENILCPAECLADGGSLWGTDLYTDDSSICRAAIHAGIIPNEGGEVTIWKTPGQASYSGSTRNGITTKHYGAWPGSFKFSNSTDPITPKPTNMITQNIPVTATCTTTAKDITGSSANVLCPAECLADGTSVWGTDVYTDDSSICRAAIHAGLIPNEGGEVTVWKTPGHVSYSGSTRNGITTKHYGAWPGSFKFSNSTDPITPKPTNMITQNIPVSYDSLTCIPGYPFVY